MKKNIFKEFKDFLTRGNILDLAVGIIIGNAFTNIIKSFVKDMVMPLIGMVLGKVDFSQLKWILVSAGDNQNEVAIMYGNFIQAVSNFFIISLCIFLFFIFTGHNPESIKTKDEAQSEKEDKRNKLLEEIRDELKKGNKQDNKSKMNEKNREIKKESHR